MVPRELRMGDGQWVGGHVARDTSRTGGGVPTEQRGNVPLAGPSPGPGSLGQVRETPVFLCAPPPTDLALGCPGLPASASSPLPAP